MDEITTIKTANQASIGKLPSCMTLYHVLCCVQHDLIWMLLIYGTGTVYAMRNRVKHCSPWYFYIRFVYTSRTIFTPDYNEVMYPSSFCAGSDLVDISNFNNKVLVF